MASSSLLQPPQLVGRLVLPGSDGIPNVGGQLHWKSSVERHSSKAGLLVESLPELAASGDGFESLANILREDWNDGHSSLQSQLGESLPVPPVRGVVPVKQGLLRPTNRHAQHLSLLQQ